MVHCKLSIIIPVYNAELYLKSCIDSVLNQTFKEFELILVDDGSTDSSLEICKGYLDKRVKVISKENGGVSSARYAGYKEAIGEWITFIDNDDLVAPNMYEYLFSLAEEDTNIDIACISRIDLYNEQIEQYSFEQTEEYLTILSGRQACEATVEKVNYNLRTPIWGRIYKRALLKEIDFLKYEYICPNLFMEDVLVCYIILLKAKKIVFSNQVLYIHRELLSSISRSGVVTDFFLEQIESYRIKLDFLHRNNLQKLYVLNLRTYSYCLMRCYYYLIRDQNTYKSRKIWIERINKYTKEYYNEIQYWESSCIHRFNFFVFRDHRYLWCKTLGLLYFSLISRLKKYIYQKKIKNRG